MENFTFYSPTYFAFGNGEENHTGSYIKRFGGSRVLIHYGGGSVVRSGLLDRVKKVPGGGRHFLCRIGRGETKSQKRAGV
ncbi:hypothetical protein [Anaerostipes caccae]|uniref:hypothetical protein n=1 Tax=Anaerostipes caccae TaxID=105841 RepID=UPI000304C270|nr:hypothetical protein [Anaerostipes caccae]